MSEIYSAFNRYKNMLYDNKFEKFKLTEIAKLILNKNKTQKEKEILKQIFIYVETMKKSIEDLGTKLSELNIKNLDFDGIDTDKRLEEHMKDIVIYIDLFVDALIAMMNAYNYDETKYHLKKSSSYLKAVRNKFIQKSTEFKIKILKNPNEEKNFKILTNDIINIFVQEAYSLRILVLYEKIKEALENG